MMIILITIILTINMMMIVTITAGQRLRPIPLLTLSLLTLLESDFPGKSLGNPYGPGNSTP